MPDIALRLNKDMLVLSTPFDHHLRVQGFTEEADRPYVVLCEPELIEESYRLEKVIGTSCLVAPTEDITQARLAYARFEDRAADMARIAYEAAAACSPQHIVAAIAPTGLPLDPSSAPSLKQSRAQYQDAVRALSVYPFDALFFSGFANAYDAQCALMGARAVYDGPLMITLAPNAEGVMTDGRSLADAVALCDEYGADVIGVSSAAAPETLIGFAHTMAQATPKPLMVDIVVRRRDSRQFEPTEENPYPTPDSLVDVAWGLHRAGVQFLRASGVAAPSYTGVLAATVLGHDVVERA